MYAIEADRLTRKFGDLVAVNNLSLQIKEGEIYGFLGPNGAGKSTTIRMLCGLLRPTSGSAHVGGFSITAEPERVKQVIGYMAQQFVLYDDLTVEENLHFFAQIYIKDNKRADQQVEEIINFFNLQPYRKVLARNLSGGLRQRLSLTCAVVHQPSILFLDEPTAGIDPVSRRIMWDMLYQLANKGITLFITTHYMEEAERCNIIGFIWQGRLVANDTPQRIKETLIEYEILRLKASPLHQAFDILKRIPTIIDVNIYGDELHVVVEEAKTAISNIKGELESRGVLLDEVAQMKPTIEDVFVHLSKEEEEENKGRV